jgi:hypothetical protein
MGQQSNNGDLLPAAGRCVVLASGCNPIRIVVQ